MSPSAALDQLGRSLRDLRLSVTDRCNFRCPYCMPRDLFGADHAFVPRSELLTFEELARLVAIFARLGVRKVRLTGGEPLLRRDIESLVAMIATIDGIDDIAMTTNGSLLAQHAAGLRAAGLSRITVSLDSVDADVFAAMSDARVALSDVLGGIEAARNAGLSPVKLNAVIQRGVNDEGVLDLVDYARREELVLRFIEFMDVGMSNHWAREHVVPSAEIIATIDAVHPLVTAPPTAPDEVARRWTYADGRGEIGVISSVTDPFCGGCTRARVTATGELFTCLFAEHGRDLRDALRGGATDDAIASLIDGVWAARDDRYSELRSESVTGAARAEMSYLGG
jgi:GTP 3',8-cyclase